MSFLPSLPPELILEINNNLAPGDVNSLMRTCHELYRTLCIELYKSTVKSHPHCIGWAAERGLISTMDLAVRAGHDIHGGQVKAAADLVDHDYAGVIGFCIPSPSPSYNPILGIVRTPLHAAISNGQNEAVLFLVQRGAGCPPAKDKGPVLPGPAPRPVLPIHCAIYFCQLSTLRLLIHLGADVNQCSHFSSTTLECAVSFSRPEIISKLISRGANIYKTTDPSTSLLTLAFERWRLAEEGVYKRRDIMDTSPKVWELLVDSGAPVISMDFRRRSLLRALLEKTPGPKSADAARAAAADYLVANATAKNVSWENWEATVM